MTPLEALTAFYEGVSLGWAEGGRRVVVEFTPGKQSPERQEAIRRYVAARQRELADELAKKHQKRKPGW